MIVVQFNDLDEFLTELEREATAAPDTREKLWSPAHDRYGNVERGIVRYTSRMHDTGIPHLMVQRVSFVAGFIAHPPDLAAGRLVEIHHPCGGYQLEPVLDEEKHARVADRAKALEASLLAVCDRLGLDARNGAFAVTE